MLAKLLHTLATFPRAFYFAGGALWAVVILVVLLLPGSTVPRLAIPHADKVIHAGMFFVLAYFVWFALEKSEHTRNTIRLALPTWLIAVSYGIVTELIQKTAATRTAETLDAVADAAGATVYILLMVWLSRRVTRAGS